MAADVANVHGEDAGASEHELARLKQSFAFCGLEREMLFDGAKWLVKGATGNDHLSQVGSRQRRDRRALRPTDSKGARVGARWSRLAGERRGTVAQLNLSPANQFDGGVSAAERAPACQLGAIPGHRA